MAEISLKSDIILVLLILVVHTNSSFLTVEKTEQTSFFFGGIVAFLNLLGLLNYCSFVFKNFAFIT